MKRNCKSSLWKRMGCLMPPQPLTNFELEKYYQNEPRFNGFYSRNNLPKKIKGGVYVMSVRFIALFCNRNEIVYFDSFGVEQHVPEEIKEFIGNKSIKGNIFPVQANNSVMCGYFCIGFIDFMLAGKTLTGFPSMCSPYDFKKNDHIHLSYFKNEWIW